MAKKRKSKPKLKDGRGKRHSKTQIAKALREVASGKKVAEVARKLGVSDWTIYNWKKSAKQKSAGRPPSRTKNQIAMILREAARGKVAEVARKHGVSNSTIHNWRSKYESGTENTTRVGVVKPVKAKKKAAKKVKKVKKVKTQVGLTAVYSRIKIGNEEVVILPAKAFDRIVSIISLTARSLALSLMETGIASSVKIKHGKQKQPLRLISLAAAGLE